jgi:hypothetical protein
MMPQRDTPAAWRLLRLVDELVDAHEDTVRLVVEGADGLEWQTHADYLRALQRLGRSALADVAMSA